MIEIRKAYTSRMTWAQLKAGVKDSTVPLYAGDEIDITLKTGENVTLVCERIRDGRATLTKKEIMLQVISLGDNASRKMVLIWKCPKKLLLGFSLVRK